LREQEKERERDRSFFGVFEKIRGETGGQVRGGHFGFVRVTGGVGCCSENSNVIWHVETKYFFREIRYEPKNENRYLSNFLLGSGTLREENSCWTWEVICTIPG
jgi:hypothetical protein